ncbi:peptidylprolyl isomerase, partial [Patescibacteria group bacterium]|nr:peptidylprolyl isomerase [Patescibacteria group bacterium]
SQGENLGAAVPDEKEMKKQVLDRLISNKLSYQLAKKYNIKISDDELEGEIQKILDQGETKESIEQTLEEQYGWGIDEFKEKVLKPFLIQQKLQEMISRDESLNQEAKKKAEDVLAEVQKGEKSFEDLAKEYSEDSSAEDGGDLNYFGRGVMVSEFEAAAFSLGVGEVSDLVLTDYGYHIIKVTDQIKDDNGEVSQVRASHILIKTKNLDDFLKEETEKAKIWQLVKI